VESYFDSVRYKFEVVRTIMLIGNQWRDKTQSKPEPIELHVGTKKSVLRRAVLLID
jgi:hypothetical protein